MRTLLLLLLVAPIGPSWPASPDIDCLPDQRFAVQGKQFRDWHHAREPAVVCPHQDQLDTRRLLCKHARADALRCLARRSTQHGAYEVIADGFQAGSISLLYSPQVGHADCNNRLKAE